MTNANSGAGRGLRMPLAYKLALILLVVAGVMVVFSLLYVGPQTTQGFLDKSGRLIDHSSDAMRRMAFRHASRSSEVIADLIRHTADSRRRMLTDLPLTLYSGDVERMRGAILARDADRSRQLEANVAVLTREMERRELHRVDRHIETLRSDQDLLSQSLADELRRSNLTLSGIVFLVLIAFLGLGLHFAIIRPIRSLQAATLAVARGDLSVSPSRAPSPRNSDEVGALSSGFAAMVEQLRASRAEVEQKTRQLEDWNKDLQAEVERQSRQLVHAAKMASVGTLAGGIAHEFNNLIGGIQGCAKELLERAAAAEREPLEVILRATNRATQITQQLLRFAQKRIEKRSRVSVTQLLGEVLDLIAPQARGQGVTVEQRIAADLAVLGDGDALHQVFLNLVTNALQAMAGGGTLTVTAAPSGDCVTVSIEDTGTGIEPEHLEHVFEPFFTGRGGTGLGLSVSYGIIDAHQGKLEVSSAAGHGSKFTATIPIQP